MVLMPGEGYEGVTKFVLDVMTSYGLNACPPLLGGRRRCNICGDSGTSFKEGTHETYRFT